MTIDETIARLTELKKVAKNGGKTEVCMCNDDPYQGDNSYYEVMFELDFATKNKKGVYTYLPLRKTKKKIYQILVVR